MFFVKKVSYKQLMLIVVFVCINNLFLIGQTLHQLNKNGFGNDLAELVDWDKDGDLDIVLFQSGVGIVFLKNDIQKQFPITILQTDGFTFAVNDFKVIDLDKDGDFDFVVSSGFKPLLGSSDGELYRLENNGDGTFTKWLVAQELKFNQASIADLNGDGKLDIAATDNYSTSIYLADGFGNYTKKQVDTDNEGNDLIIADDVDGDADIDLIIGGTGTYVPPDFISGSKILKNDGSGNFSYFQSLPTPTGLSTTISSDMKYVDLNNDNVKDIVAFSIRSSGGFYFLDGADNFENYRIDRQGIDCGGKFEIFDIDGNGFKDIIRQHRCDDHISILYQNDSLSFSTEYIELDWNARETRTAAGDMDGDGDTDFISSSRADISWWENINGKLYRHLIYGDNVEAGTAKFGDVDQDGDLDVLVAAAAISTSQTDELLLYINEGNNIFKNWRVVDGFNGAIDADFADMDNDGDLDIIGSAKTDNNISWFENKGTPYDFVRHTVDDLANEANRFFPTDLNKDGNMDVVAALGDKILWYKSNGSSNPFTKIVVDANITGILEIESGDMNKDGQIDVIAIGEADNSIIYYQFNGTNSFTKKIIKTGERMIGVQIIDVNADNNLDIIAVSSSSSYGVVAHLGNGMGEFSETELIANPSGYGAIYSVKLADMDKDSDLDILIGGYQSFGNDGELFLVENSGGTYGTPQSLYEHGYSLISDISVGDYNRDGSLDVAFADWFREAVFVIAFPSSDCPFDLPVNGSISNEIYKASSTITSNGTIETGADVTFIAGSSITLNTDFHAQKGSTFLAQIEDCIPLTLQEEEAYRNVVENNEKVDNTDLNQAIPFNQEVALQISPNPFSNRTNFLFHLPETELVNIRILDVNGHLVEQIVNNQWMEYGQHEIQYQSKDLRAGMYYVILQAGRDLQTRKMVLIQ